MLKQIILVVAISFGLVSCAGDNNTGATADKTATPTTAPKSTSDSKTAMETTTTPATSESGKEKGIAIDWDADELLIQEAGLAGVFSGQHMSGVEGRIGKELAKTAEGEFVHYNFTDSNKNTLGYFMLDPTDQTLIGDVVITSPKAATKDGIRVGSTYGELKAIAPNLVVHGSEIESRANAYVGSTAYLLDVAINTYEVDESHIKSDTKIKEIRIMRYPQKK